MLDMHACKQHTVDWCVKVHICEDFGNAWVLRYMIGILTAHRVLH